MLVQKLKRVCLVAVIVLTEHHINQMLLIVHQRQRIELMIPDNVVRYLQRRVCRGSDQLVKRGHKLGDLYAALHTGNTVVTAGNNTKQLAVGRTVLSDRHRRVAGLFLKRQHIRKRLLRAQVGVGYDEARFVRLDAGDHSRLALDGL